MTSVSQRRVGSKDRCGGKYLKYRAGEEGQKAQPNGFGDVRRIENGEVCATENENESCTRCERQRDLANGHGTSQQVADEEGNDQKRRQIPPGRSGKRTQTTELAGENG